MQSTIRFVRPNRYRKAIGETDSQMGFGVHSALVQRGIAEFVSETPLVSAAVSEPVANTDNTKRSRKSRSFDSTEE